MAIAELPVEKQQVTNGSVKTCFLYGVSDCSPEPQKHGKNFVTVWAFWFINIMSIYCRLFEGNWFAPRGVIACDPFLQLVKLGLNVTHSPKEWGKTL